ncbi:MAG: VOC family protein [Tepidiformaceae bacterium]
MDDLEAALERVKAAGPSGLDVPGQDRGIASRPWGERSFYCQDPAGNPICFVDAGTEFTGSTPLA